MSGSRARKVQPFTITTKLSLPKYSLDFPGDSCPSIPIAALDNHVLHQNLNERVSLYLAQAPSVPTGGRFGCTSPVEEVVINEDRINRNSLSRSIKKITLSNWHGEPSPDEEAMLKGPAHTSCERNCNNNNCRTGKAQFKVFLRKEVGIEEEKQEARKHQASGHSSVARVAPLHMISGCAVAAPWKENTQAGEVGLKPCSQRSTGLTDLCKWNPQVAQFNCDMMQAEKWVCAKLRGLKDGCSIQEWERVAQTLQRDMKDFENTMIKLNQMGEQLTAQPNPSAEIVRRLQTLREQWQLLKQTAANQSKAVGGLRNLQEFNQKAEQLEAWIRQKEEKPLLTALLQENADKIQLTRRILDLKQEEEQFQALHEQMNSLAHKLEKQEKSESRSIMARRKHLNKMWLRLQGTLKEHHETLHLALEAAAFLQQADVVLRAIHTKQRNLCGVGKWKEPETSPDLAVRDIAGQVMMLDVTVSQLISLHPSLMAQVSLKHQDVKESWAQLQQLLRSEKPPLLALTRKSIDSPSSKQVRTTMSNSAVREAGEKTVWEVQKDIQGSQESNSDSPGKEVIASDSRRRRRKLLWHSNALKDLPQQEAHLQDFCQVADGELHKRSPQVEDALEELEDLWEELRRKHQANGVALREIDTALRLVGELEEAECWLGTVIGLLSEPAATKNLDDLHGDLEKIGTLENQVGAWSVKLRALQKEMQMESSSEHTAAAMIQRKMESVKKKLACVQEALQRRASDLKDSVILTEFLQNVRLEEMLSQRNQIQVVPNQLGSQEPLHLLITQSSQQLSSEDMSRSLEELQEAVEMLNNMVKEREQAMEAVAKMETLKCFVQALTSGEETRLAWVTSQMETIRDRAETLAQDIIQAERSFAAVKSEVDLLELQGLVKRQKEIESDMSALEGDMEELERAFSQLQECYLEQISKESRRISEILEAWKDLQKLVLGNAVREQQAAHLRQFFRAYLAIISWTEDTRAQIFSESLSACGLSEAQWEELENNMETKFKEFEDLAAAGWKLVAEEHFLSETIKERMEELQSMLGWVMVRWRAQSSQADSGNKNDGKKTQDGILNMLENCQIKVAHEAGVSKASDILNSSVSEGPPLTLGSLQNGSATQQESESVSTAVLSTLDVLPVHKESVEESLDIPKESLILEPSETPVLLVPQPGPGSLGGTVNLILSIGKKVRREGTGSQVEGAPSMGQETLHKYLPSKLELQMMEGSLERKHLLQAGGKKANCRSWNTFHTVLMRQTLCFYQDKKDTLKSSVVALPLNLCGAICTLETEYTKKNNCFTLQLKDGSKYLLRAPTEPLMKEWITKLQQNSGLPEVDYFQSASQTAQGTMSAVSVIPNHGVSHFLGLHQPLTAKSQEAVLPPRSSVRLQLPHDTQDDPLDSSASQTENNHKSAASYTTEHSLRQCSPTEFARPQDPYIFPEEDCGLVTNKRRSYSFTSATYQKITPLSVSKEPLGLGSSYSVTLYIGEQAPAAPRPRCHSFIASSSGARETLSERTQGSSPRQKNKSVFRKFFGKKD
ncbi:spectrin beta chain, non-erythrocytic 1-like isoform X5 [Rhineura floridana]|uniref:spectrin beta chain, non-erythrocytic 1-like isoform X5 n=1 Tax=Rhineura floridana TaxID=261503 RepID=UPI002AC7FA82|nr:spectrin beta chain, non-erythrocytic 1-like isoform X5 [Rhineura floridana]